MSRVLHAMSAMLLAALGCGSIVIAQDYRYAMFEIGTLGGDWSVANAINDSAQVVATAKIDQIDFHAALWESGVLMDLDPSAPCCGSEAWGINSSREIVGRTTTGTLGVIWLPDGSRIELGTLGGRFTQPFDINDSRQVVGKSMFDPETFFSHPFLWEDGQMIDLGTFGGTKGEASAINNCGQVVGTAWPPNGQTKPFLWENGQLIQLPDIGGPIGWAFDINEDELIVGFSTSPGLTDHAVKWINRQIVDLHDASVANWSGAHAVNNHGVILGNMQPRGTQQTTAFIIIDDRMVDLNTLAPPRRQRQIARAWDINDAGVIVGETRGDPVRGYVLSPVTPSMTLDPPAPGLAGRRNTLRVTGATPGVTVHFVYGTYGGGTIIPGCGIQVNALQIRNPSIIGTAIADQNGVASITRTVPPIARGQTILFQAVVQNECAISQLVVHQFE